MSSQEMRQRVAELIRARAGKLAALEAILSSRDLFGDGFLDSLASVALVHELEREFQVKIGPFLVTKKNFSSVGSICALLLQRGAGS